MYSHRYLEEDEEEALMQVGPEVGQTWKGSADALGGTARSQAEDKALVVSEEGMPEVAELLCSQAGQGAGGEWQEDQTQIPKSLGVIPGGQLLEHQKV